MRPESALLEDLMQQVLTSQTVDSSFWFQMLDRVLTLPQAALVCFGIAAILAGAVVLFVINKVTFPNIHNWFIGSFVGILVLFVVGIVIATAGPRPPKPELPPPPLASPLPSGLSPECRGQVVQFNSYLEEYNRTQNDPTSQSRALGNLAVISHCVKRHKQAELEFITAIGLIPNLKTTEDAQVLTQRHLTYGIWLAEMNRTAEAMAQFELGLTISDGKPSLRIDHARLRLQRGTQLAKLAKCTEAQTDYDLSLAEFRKISGKPGDEGVTIVTDWKGKPCP
jgi:hypothetical protein